MPASARVLIVDDSRIFRAALEAALAGEEGIEVVGSVFNGAKALEFIRTTPPDVVTLDVEMPGMDGLETLAAIRQLDAAAPQGAEMGVIMVSAHTKRGADVTVQALSRGAFDFVAKPAGPQAEVNLALLRQQLVAKIRLFLAERSRRSGNKTIPTATRRAEQAFPSRRANRRPEASRRPIRAIVIASSTGGPKALEALLPDLSRRVELPILIVQHMPPTFTRSLADSLGRISNCPVAEALDGEPLCEKRIYLAPGGKHLLLRSDPKRLILGLNEQPPENGCRPSADVLFRSAAAAMHDGLVAIVLTGMGRDGTAGLGAIKRAGGYAVVQDEATSVVWGMPGSAAEAGLADEILPLDEIAPAVESLIASIVAEGGNQ
ncbi:MAG: chemotaxis-specific protein-glutamate methyltransferase CheB [Pirellulales bacterium]|nr:chemotaxis-specific protein-glutamate methyltransferase CheB [Pirellulales bacterium]